jgi:hypothetical protein
MNKWNNEIESHPISPKFHENVEYMWQELINRPTVIKLMNTSSSLINQDDYAAIIAFQCLFPHLYDQNTNPNVVQIVPSNPPKPSDYAFQIAAYYKAYHSTTHGHIFERLLDPRYCHNVMRSNSNYLNWEHNSTITQQQTEQHTRQLQQVAQQRTQHSARTAVKPLVVEQSQATLYKLKPADHNWANFYVQDPVKATAAGYTRNKYDAYLRKKSATEQAAANAAANAVANDPVSLSSMNSLQQLRTMQADVERRNNATTNWSKKILE